MSQLLQWVRRNHLLETAAAVFSVLLCLVVCMMFTGQWPWNANPYNSYALQACSWLEGRLDLGRDYSYLELAIYKDKYFVSFPPFPSFLLLPFTIFLGSNTPDGWISLCFTLIGVVYAMNLYRQLVGNAKHAVFWVTFLYLGTGYLYIALFPGVWFFAQTLCFTLSLAALYYSVCGKGGLSLTAWACAVGCRPMVALYLPLLAWNLWTHWKNEHPGKHFGHFILNKLYWAIPTCLIAFSYMILNYLRFDNPFQFGHDYLPEFTRLETGQFSFSYVANNLHSLVRLPNIKPGGKVDFPSLEGFAFYISNPFLVTVLLLWAYTLIRRFCAKVSARPCLASRKLETGYNVLLLGVLPVLALLHVLILTMHHTMGGTQWGNRYLLDILPYLFLGFVFTKPENDDRLVTFITPLYLYGAVISAMGTFYITLC